MKELRDLSLTEEYRTTECDVVKHFFAPCLSRAREYRRAVGYFRSSIFTVLPLEMIEFARSGGHMKLVCSPNMSVEDVAELADASDRQTEVVNQSIERDLSELEETYAVSEPIAILGTLVRANVLSIKIAIRVPDIATYHEKMGVFEDENGDRVSFKGSSNETFSGWHPEGNLESIEVFASWWDSSNNRRTRRHRDYLERLWRNEVSGVRVLEFSYANRKRLIKAGFDSIDALEERIKKGAKDAGRPLRPHQDKTLANWRAAGHRGIVKHATGSGKTFTALKGVAEWLEDGGVAVIVVPTKALLVQWRKEIKDVLPEASVLECSGDVDWRAGGRVGHQSRKSQGKLDRIILVTLQTASDQDFIQRLKVGKHTLLVADEVHRVGSPRFGALMSIDAGGRLGLSATPERYGDPEGTRRIKEYFGEVLEPVVDLAGAIADGYLCPYEYRFHQVLLTEDEINEWNSLTANIVRVCGQISADEKGLSEQCSRLLFRRARIAKKAAAKIDKARDIVSREYKEGDRWLVYCEDRQQLDAVREAIETLALRPLVYYSEMDADSNATLEWFRESGGILVSIRCLDEGVDIPRATHALILASSRNPREYTQRRGRVLRQAREKTFATVHDVMVVPDETEPVATFRGLVQGEISRALEFAKGAINQSTNLKLRDLARRLEIDPDAGAVESDEEHE